MRKVTLLLLLTLLGGVSFTARAQYGFKVTTDDGPEYQYYIRTLQGTKYLNKSTTTSNIINSETTSSTNCDKFIFKSSTTSDAYNIYLKGSDGINYPLVVSSETTKHVQVGNSASVTPQDFYITKVVSNKPDGNNQPGLFITTTKLGNEASGYTVVHNYDSDNTEHPISVVTQWNAGVNVWNMYTVETAAPAPMVFSAVDQGTLASYSTPIAATIPEGVTAYYAESNTPNNGTLKLAQITDGIIPAGQGVIIEQSAESPTAAYYQPTTTTTTSTVTSALTATSGSTWSLIPSATLPSAFPYTYTTAITSSTTGEISVPNSNNIYGLGTVNNIQGFYHFSETSNISMPPYKAYLNTTSNAGAIKLEFPDGSTTSIHGVNVAPRTDNAATYDLSGRRVTKTVKGNLYIQNGKKFLAE